MKKLWLLILPVLVAGFVVNRAFSSPDRPARPERKAMEEVFAMAGQGFRLGVSLSEISPHLRDDLKIESGVVVDEVFSDSPAAKAGIQEGDILVSVDGNKIESERDIRKMMREMESPKEMTFEVIRDGKPLKINVTPEKREFNMMNVHLGGNYIGVDLQELDADLSQYFQTTPGAGVLISRVEPDSPAEKAGLKSGDVITDLNGTKVSSQEDLRARLNDLKEGESANLTVLRHGKTQKLSVTPERRDFQMPEIQGLRELRHLRDLPEIRNFAERPEFRESMEQLKLEMEKLKEEMEQLKKELHSKN